MFLYQKILEVGALVHPLLGDISLVKDILRIPADILLPGESVVKHHTLLSVVGFPQGLIYPVVQEGVRKHSFVGAYYDPDLQKRLAEFELEILSATADYALAVLEAVERLPQELESGSPDYTPLKVKKLVCHYLTDPIWDSHT